MRELRFRAWVNWYANSDTKFMLFFTLFDITMNSYDNSYFYINTIPIKKDTPLMQFTGLKDKNNLTDIYEGDIIDENGIVRGNIYESPSLFRKGIDFVITEMGINSWRDTESIAMGRGCKYAK